MATSLYPTASGWIQWTLSLKKAEVRSRRAMNKLSPSVWSSTIVRATGRLARQHRHPQSCYRYQHRLNSSFGPTNVPPIRERLKPLIPFFIKWSIITSLAVHLLRIRHRSVEELGRCEAKESVLESMIARVRQGEELEDREIRRDMEMVGLRERTALTQSEADEMRDTADVTWIETLFGRKRRRRDPAAEEKAAVDEWVESECQSLTWQTKLAAAIQRDANAWLPSAVVRETTASTPSTSLISRGSSPISAEQRAYSRRAPSSNVYL